MANTYTNLLYHIVFSCKDRRRSIHQNLRDDLYAYIGGIVRNEGGLMLEIGGVADHVHLVVRLKADMPVATMVRQLKARSSKWAAQRADSRGFRWQRGYGAFSVSESRLKRVCEYVRGQEEHHQTMSFRDELVGLLKRHGIAFDEEYLPG